MADWHDSVLRGRNNVLRILRARTPDYMGVHWLFLASRRWNIQRRAVGNPWRKGRERNAEKAGGGEAMSSERSKFGKELKQYWEQEGNEKESAPLPPSLNPLPKDNESLPPQRAVLEPAAPSPAPLPAMTEGQIKYIVNRFLQWRLPEDFNPDGGISFKRMFNEKTPWPMKS